jgi:hypothetical protein
MTKSILRTYWLGWTFTAVISTLGVGGDWSGYFVGGNLGGMCSLYAGVKVLSFI